VEDAEVVLRRAPLFEGLDEESARALRRQMLDVKLSRGEHLFLEGQDGDRLYVVMAEQRVDRPGREGWAGIGWVQHEETGRGLFVEHEANSERQVRDDIERSLSALMDARPHVSFGAINAVVQGVRCEGTPVCAMVVAVYEASGWTVDLRGS